MLTNASVVAIASAIGFDLPTAAGVAAVLSLLSVGIPLVGRILTYLGRDHSGEPLDKVRRSLEARLRELERPLVVFVDDIDRLEPEQIRMLLRQVKANANLPNIVFVLLFQTSIVERALDPVADGDGRAFLEKIVQASFDLPAVPASLVHRMFEEELAKIADPYAIEANGFSQTRWGNAYIGCIQPWLKNMRDARRLISSIAINMPLHVIGNVFEVNIVDFLLLETLRVFEPDLHATLFRERELVLQERRYSFNNRQKLDQEAAKKLLEIVPEKRRDIVRDTLKDLFPPLEWAYGGTHYADGFHLQWLAEKRVCTSRYFPRYFELQTTIGEMSERRFVDFLDATATERELYEEITTVEADGLLNSLVARLDESVDRLPTENASILLPGMFILAEKLASSKNGAFDPSYVAAWRATNKFLKRLPEDVRNDLALDALRKTKALSVSSLLIHLSDPDDRENRDSGVFEPALDLNTITEMKAEWLRLIRGRAADGNTLLTEPNLIYQLYRWKDYTNSIDEPREWVMKVIQTNQGFAAVISRLMHRGTSYTYGDRVSTPHNSFNKETIADFIGIDVAKARIDSINLNEFPEYEEALKILLMHLEKWLGLREDDLFD